MAETIERRLLTTKEAAKYLGLGEGYLRELRMNGDRKNRLSPPPFIRSGRAVRYDIRDLDEWIEANRIDPTES